MTSCHRPRVYRSTDGCCICGAKSSSSRFTASTRYESYFERCFALSVGEQRRGDICNACVLLVKRFRKLPTGSTRCWAHVKDARSGPGLKSMSRIKNQRQLFTDDADDFITSPDTACKQHVISSSLTSARVSATVSQLRPTTDRQTATAAPRTKNSSGMFIDSDYWTPVKTCCGFVYRGLYGDYLIDAGLYQRCDSHHLDATVTMATAAESVDSGNDNSEDIEDDLADDMSQSASSTCYLADETDCDERLSADDVAAA